jgi:hypothetical protein
MAVNATVGNQSEKMEPMTTRARKNFPRSRIPAEFAIRDRLVDSSKILINDPACPQVEMAYFRVPHLSFGEANVETARAQPGTRVFVIQPVVKWRPRQQSSVAVFFAPLLPAGVNAPAVANNEHDRFRHGGAVCRGSAKRTSASFVDNANYALLHRLS